MQLPPARAAAQIIRSRAIGCSMGALIGAGWLAFGLSSWPNAVRVPLALLGLGVLVWLLNGSRKLAATARDLPASDAPALATNRRVWTWFWLNLLVEIVLLNVAVNLLAAPPLHVFWIPAISCVVGLHFLPMAWFLAVPSYWACGGAFIGVAAGTAMGIASQAAAPALLASLEAAVNACILWGTVAWGLRAVLPALRRSPG